ncbi:hypothetical protein ACWGPT_06935 [Pseudorhizobium sp. NPDC055634]
MSADVIAFPRRAPQQPTLGQLLQRRNDPSLSHYEREQLAVVIDMHRAAGHFLTLPADPDRRETGITAGSEALEGALFHALSLKGCLNGDLELRRLLAARLQERETLERNSR